MDAHTLQMNKEASGAAREMMDRDPMSRRSLEAAFEREWPKLKPRRRDISLDHEREPEDVKGLGQPAGWSEWIHDGEAYGVLTRMTLGDGTTLQFRNLSSETKKVTAKHGNIDARPRPAS